MTIVPCVDLDKVSPAYRRFCMACWVISSLFTLVFSFMVIFVVLNRSPVMDYGRTGDLWLERGNQRVEVVHGGETLNLVFGNTTWLRLCQSDFAAFVKIGQDAPRRFDLPVHRIIPPGHGGKLVPPKSREIKMPLFGAGVVGPAEMWAEVSSYCWPPDKWWPITTRTPPIFFTVE